MSTQGSLRRPKLSICITTFNRGAFIGATLDSILPQLTADCEVVVVDGASSDDTARILAGYAQRCERLRYLTQSVNNGMDRDYDAAVELARGDYCWLMTDDDFIKPGGAAAVLRALQGDVDVVIVNVESKDFCMQRVVQRRWMTLRDDRRYSAQELDRLFIDAQEVIRYVGCTVIKRSLWLARDRQRYCGTWWLYAGVVFQAALPGSAVIIAEPLVSYRMGNLHTFGAIGGELLLDVWPTMVESFAVSAAARRKVPSSEPWRNFEWLLFLRATGTYSWPRYRSLLRPRLTLLRAMFMPALVAAVPSRLANAVLVAHHALRRNEGRLAWLKTSRFYLGNWRIFHRKRNRLVVSPPPAKQIGSAN